MAEQEQDAKTEEPTDKRLRDARRKGDTPASREPAAVAGAIALLVIVAWLAPATLASLRAGFAGIVEAAPLVAIDGGPARGTTAGGGGPAAAAGLSAATGPMLGAVARALAPVLGALVALGLLGVLAQGRIAITPSRLAPGWSKVSPAAGAKRLLGTDALMEFAKNLLKVSVVAVAAAVIGVPAVTEIWRAPSLGAPVLLGHVGGAAARMLAAVAVAMAAIAVADVAWKRARWRRRNRMTPKEVRDEHKESDGDPHVRARRDSVRRTRARQRMATAVPTATVVITNPTHYAVALRYEAGRDAAPVCIAKGVERRAARIRELARAADVPIIEQKPLARALHATLEVGDPVPTEHWQAVAEIIGYVADLRRDLRPSAPAGAQLRDRP